MASRSLMESAVINNVKTTTLTTDNLVVNNSNEDEKINNIDLTTSSTNSIVNSTNSIVNSTNSTVNTFDSKLDQINNQLISNSSFLQRTPKIKNNPQALLSLCNINSTAFINSTTYRFIGLYGFINRHSGTYASPECAGVWNTEQLLQENIKLTTFADATPDSTVTWTVTGPNPNFNYYSDACLRTFGIFSRLLAYEDAMGASQDGALAYSYYNPTNNKLHLLLPNTVSNEFVPGSFFLKCKVHEKLAYRNYETLPCQFSDAQWESLYAEFNKQLDILSDEAGFTMTPSTGTPLSIVKTKLEWLFWGHSLNIKANVNSTNKVATAPDPTNPNIELVLWTAMQDWWKNPANDKPNGLKKYLSHTDVNDYIPYLQLNIGFGLKGTTIKSDGTLLDNSSADAYKEFEYPFDWTIFGYLEYFYKNIWNIVSLNTAMGAYCEAQLSDLVDINSAVTIANGKDDIHKSATGYSIDIKNTGLRDVLSSMIKLPSS